MSERLRNELPNGSENQADATLRLIASLPAPEGLADRLHGKLRDGSGRVLSWPMRRTGGGGFQGWLRGAAAAAIVCVVAGGAWGVYSRSAQAPAANAVAVPVRVHPATGFSSANAIKTPDTLKGAVLTHHAQAGKMQKDKSAKKPAPDAVK